MAWISYPNNLRVLPGDTVSGSILDQTFSMFTGLMNSSKLDVANFRANSSIGRAKKAAPNTFAPVVMNIPVITMAQSQTVSLKGMWALEHYSQYPPAQSAAVNGDVQGRNAAPVPFGIAGLQGLYHSGTNIQAGDTLTLQLEYRQIGGNTVVSSTSLNIKGTANVINVSTPALTNLDYAHAYVIAVTDATAVTRTWNHITVVIWVTMPQSS